MLRTLSTFSGVSLILFMFIIPSEAALTVTEAAVKYNEAGAEYRNGRFNEAFQLYRALIDNGIKNPDLYYNAANAAYRTESLGLAILYLERAQKLAPSDKDIQANLAFLNSIKADTEPANSNALFAYIIQHYDALNINAMAIASLLSFILMLTAVTAGLFSPGWKRMTLLITGASLACLFLISTGILAQKMYHEATVTEAVIMADEASAYSGPGNDNTHIFTLHEGTKVTIERGQDGWNLIRLKSGAGGWIKAESMESI